MPDAAVTEAPLQFGEGGRLLGILTSPGTAPRGARPVFVFLSAGLLHRVGPYRLHVRLARTLAHLGFASLRVDLAGMGDSPPHDAPSYRASVDADFAAILQAIDAHAGPANVVLAGLCTGADNATLLALREPRVAGLVLLDPICYPDRGYATRVVAAKYGDPSRYAAWLRRRVRALLQPAPERTVSAPSVDPLALRDLPSLEQVREAFAAVRDRGGRVMAVFTEYANRYYNRQGQLGRVLHLPGYETLCTELHWPATRHTYCLERDRLRLIEHVVRWSAHYARD
jgi:pimeloyl-ACP methyl ester carboxylesterase